VKPAPAAGKAPFLPRDLRRTAATICGNLEFIGIRHFAVSRPSGDQGRGWQPLPAVTNKVYNLSVVGRVERKRKVLDAWAVELRRIVGGLPSENVVGLLAA
jgi:hypothetical protein